MNLWIDLANSPQVLFFRPLVAELERRGHTVLLTSRDFAQTVPLANRYGFKHASIGQHGGKAWTRIFQRTLGRANGLAQWARTQLPIDLAISHNSYSHALAAARLRIPFVTLMDYEFQPANHLAFRLAERVIVPECFPDTSLRRFGAAHKTQKYAGIKEQIYLADFSPQSNYFQTLGIDTTRPVVVMRPPGPWAAYHRDFESTLFDEVLEYVSAQNVSVIFSPRVREQGEHARALGKENIWVPPQVLDGPNLLYHADAVISGGGTMNREAGILGTPAYTVFRGKLGAVDEYLIARGRMTQIREQTELPTLVLDKKTPQNVTTDMTLVNEVVSLILDTLPARRNMPMRANSPST